MLKLATERVLQFKCSDPEGRSYRTKRASSSYLVWQDGQARVLVDAGGGSALRFGESGAKIVPARRNLVHALPR